MSTSNERHVDYAAYLPWPEDDDGLTPLQIHERRVSTLRVTRLRYCTAMTTEQAKVVLNTTTHALMDLLDLDMEQVADLKQIAQHHQERLEMAGVK